MNHKKIFLFTGLILIALAIFSKLMNLSNTYFWVTLGIGISCKLIFLALSLKSGSIKWGWPLYLLIIGVLLVLLSLLLRYGFNKQQLGKWLLWVGIFIKVTALIGFIFIRKVAKNTNPLDK